MGAPASPFVPAASLPSSWSAKPAASSQQATVPWAIAAFSGVPKPAAQPGPAPGGGGTASQPANVLMSILQAAAGASASAPGSAAVQDGKPASSEAVHASSRAGHAEEEGSEGAEKRANLRESDQRIIDLQAGQQEGQMSQSNGLEGMSDRPACTETISFPLISDQGLVDGAVPQLTMPLIGSQAPRDAASLGPVIVIGPLGSIVGSGRAAYSDIPCADARSVVVLPLQ